MKKVLLVSLFLVLAAFGAVGPASCSSSSTTTQSLSTTPAGQTTPLTGTGATVTQVTIQNFSFNPASITVPAGTKVDWVNNDSTAHTVISDTGAFDSGTINPQGTFSFTFATAGTYAYHCSIHPTMKGTVVVQ